MLFEDNYQPEPNTGCWLWLAGCTRRGYGVISTANGQMYAHRYAYERFVGTLGDLNVLHRCDTPSCVNPQHLFAGTQLDNIRDMQRKGRARFSPVRKLSDTDVRSIRRLYARGGHTQRALATQFGVFPNAINAIVTRRGWKDV